MDEDWTEISDAALRKRIQNRLAQRKHRRKSREQQTTVCRSDTQPSITSTTSIQPRNATAGDSFFPTSSDPLTHGVSNAKVQVDETLDAPTMEDPTSAFSAMQDFACPQWNPGTRDDGTTNVLAGHHAAGIVGNTGDPGRRSAFRPDGRASGPHKSFQRPRAASVSLPNFGSPLVWDMMSHPEHDTHQQQSQAHQHAAGEGFVVDPALSPQVMSSRLQGKQYCQPGVNTRVDHIESCSQCGADHQKSHQHSTNSVESANRGAPGFNELRSSAVPAPMHQHVSRSSRSDVPQERDIGINQILSQLEQERRNSMSALSEPLMTPQSLDRCSENATPNHQNRNSRRGHSDHQADLGMIDDSTEDEDIDMSDPRVTKVVVVYMKERNRR